MNKISGLLAAFLAVAPFATAISASDWDVYTREECVEAMDKVSRAGVVHGLLPESTARDGVMVVVDGTVWPHLDFHVKENLAHCVNRILMGDDEGRSLALISFLDHRSRRVIGKLKMLRYSE